MDSGNSVESRLKAVGIEIPDSSPPLASYLPFVVTRCSDSSSLVHIAGQVAYLDGKLHHQGRLGSDNFALEDGKNSARMCAVNILSQLKAATGGDLGKVKKIVKLTGYVQCTQDFDQQPEVLNEASELFTLAFGDDVGRHARVAVGSYALPRGVSVEIDCIAEITNQVYDP